MNRLFPRLWVLLLAGAFLALWGVSLQPAPAGVGWLRGRLVGILGWGLVGLGFLGVALASYLSARPRKPRRLVRVSAAPRRPAKVEKSIYTPPAHRRYRCNVSRRR